MQCQPRQESTDNLTIKLQPQTPLNNNTPHRQLPLKPRDVPNTSVHSREINGNGKFLQMVTVHFYRLMFLATAKKQTNK